MLSDSPPAPRKPTFLRLNYPENYYQTFSNFDPGAHVLHRRSFSNLKSGPSLNQKRHMRWVIKKPTVNPEPSRARKAPSRIQNSKSPVCNRRGPDNLDSAQVKDLQNLKCSKCLGLGHTRKECTSLVRCDVCFHYGHLSGHCFAKARKSCIFRPVSKLEGEGSRSVPIYSAPSLGASVSPAQPNPRHPR